MSPSQTNRRIVLASRPHGAPEAENFRLETVEKPTPQDGEMLLRSVYLSLDPYMRGRMSDAKSYAEPVAVDDVMVGGTVCQVEVSRHPEFEAGEWVLAYTGWQDYGISNGEGLIKLGKNPKSLDGVHRKDHVVSDLSQHTAAVCQCKTDFLNGLRITIAFRVGPAQFTGGPVQIKKLLNPFYGRRVKFIINAEQMGGDH